MTAYLQELRQNKQHSPSDNDSKALHSSPWKPAFTLSPSFTKYSLSGGVPYSMISHHTRAHSISRECNISAATDDGVRYTQKHVRFGLTDEDMDSGMLLDDGHHSHSVTQAPSPLEPNGSSSVLHQTEDARHHGTEHSNLPESDQTLSSEQGKGHSEDLSQDPERTTTGHERTHAQSTFLDRPYRCLIAAKNAERRIRLDESKLEQEYLKFLSNITKDIQAREMFTEAGIELLFKSHVASNRHRLREDVMWQKIALLRRELGLTQSTCTSS